MTYKKIFHCGIRVHVAISVAVIASSFIAATVVFGASTTTGLSSTTTTEFTPNLYDATSPNSNQGPAQTSQILEMFRGLLPNSSIDSFTKQTTPQVTTTNTNTSDVFTKNLKVGDTDQEVLLLQKALNEDPDTVIAASGAGSPGNETTYFGQRTKTAVIKLQNKHYGEVLAPNGLSSGTGYFGASTRAMMNNQQKNKDKNSVQSLGESVITTIPNAAVSGLGETVKIESLDPPRGKSGTQVTIHGSGITRSANRIIAGGQMIYNATSTDGRTLTFTIKSPAEFIFDPELSVASTTYIKSHFSEYVTKDFPILKYPVCIQNDNGLSNCAFFTIDL